MKRIKGSQEQLLKDEEKANHNGNLIFTIEKENGDVFMSKSLVAPELAQEEIVVEEEGEEEDDREREDADGEDIYVNYDFIPPLVSVPSSTTAPSFTFSPSDKTEGKQPTVKEISIPPPFDNSLELGPPTILYCHGGGFCISLLEMDLLFIGKLTKQTKAVVVVPEYALAPEYPYPCALNELEAIYYWVVQGGLGYRPRRIVLVGESAGGNILAALCVRLAKTEDPSLQKPDGLVMGYPGLNLALSPSPSRSLHMCDPLLGYGVLHTCCGAYVGACDATTDAEISPAFAPQNILVEFPLTAIMCGGMDPLLDDAVDFFTQLCRSQRTLPAQQQKKHLFKVFRALPHGFWSMGLAMPATVRAIELACDWAKMMVEGTDA